MASDPDDIARLDERRSAAVLRTRREAADVPRMVGPAGHAVQHHQLLSQGPGDDRRSRRGDIDSVVHGARDEPLPGWPRNRHLRQGRGARRMDQDWLCARPNRRRPYDQGSRRQNAAALSAGAGGSLERQWQHRRRRQLRVRRLNGVSTRHPRLRPAILEARVLVRGFHASAMAPVPKPVAELASPDPQRSDPDRTNPELRVAPIGVFDSGVGGLSVLREIRRELPAEDLIYVADSGYAPYGDRPEEYVRGRAVAIMEFLRTKDAKAVVVACNTATGIAVDALRARYDLPIVAIEPAVKPAAARISFARRWRPRDDTNAGRSEVREAGEHLRGGRRGVDAGGAGAGRSGRGRTAEHAVYALTRRTLSPTDAREGRGHDRPGMHALSLPG